MELQKRHSPQRQLQKNRIAFNMHVGTAVALNEHTRTQPQMLSYIQLFLRVLLFLPVGSFLPLFC